LIESGKDKQLSEKQWDLLFSLFDENHDGKIDYPEFVKGMELKFPDKV